MDNSDKVLRKAREDAVMLGMSAKRVLSEPAWQKIHDETMDTLFQGFLTVASNDVETMKDINQAGRALQKLKNQLESLIIIGDNVNAEEDK